MIRAQLIHQGSRSIVYRILRALFGLFLLWLAVQFVLAGNLIGGILIAGVAAVLLIRAVLGNHLLRAAIIKQYRQMGKDRDVVQYQPEPDYLRCISENADVRIKWSDFRKRKEADEVIIAYRHDKHFQVIPIGQLDAKTQHDIRHYLSTYSERA